MDENAGSYLGSFYVPTADQPKMVRLIEQFTNTVFIDVGRVLDEVKRLMNILVQVVTVLAILVGLSGILVLIACKEDIVTLDQDNVVQFIDRKFIRVLEGEKRYISKLPKSVIEWAGMTDGCHSYTSIYDWPSMYHHSFDQIIDWMTTALM